MSIPDEPWNRRIVFSDSGRVVRGLAVGDTGDVQQGRAAALDPHRESGPLVLEGDQIAVLVARVGTDRVGFPAGRLVGASMLESVVPLPGARPFHLGIAALRGEILSVIDLAAWLGCGWADGSAGLCVVVSGTAGRLALRVAEIEDLRPVEPRGLVLERQPLPARGERSVTLGLTADRVRVLDIDALLDHADFRSPRGGRADRV